MTEKAESNRTIRNVEQVIVSVAAVLLTSVCIYLLSLGMSNKDAIAEEILNREKDKTELLLLIKDTANAAQQAAMAAEGAALAVGDLSKRHDSDVGRLTYSISTLSTQKR